MRNLFVLIVVAFGLVALCAHGPLGVFAAVFSRQAALYLGAALVVLGAQLVRFGKRPLGLACLVAGAILCAYGLGYLG